MFQNIDSKFHKSPVTSGGTYTSRTTKKTGILLMNWLGADPPGVTIRVSIFQEETNDLEHLPSED